MQIEDLVAIGKLGNSLDRNGFISIKKAANIELSFFKKIFLLFTDNRVRYVEVIDLDTSKGIKVRIDDEEIAAEAAYDGNVQIMLPKKDIDQFQKENDIIDLVGISVIFRDEVLGKITEVFFNGAHDVISFEDYRGIEVMIPLVDAYVIKIEDNSIIMKNIEGFLKL